MGDLTQRFLKERRKEYIFENQHSSAKPAMAPHSLGFCHKLGCPVVSAALVGVCMDIRCPDRDASSMQQERERKGMSGAEGCAFII